MQVLDIIPECISSQSSWQDFNSGHKHAPDILLFNGIIRQADQALQDAFNQGADPATLVNGRAEFMDALLLKAWGSFDLTDHPDVSLVAVGGYGRGELHPHSDIDLMLLLACAPDEVQVQKLSAFITFLWDIGLPVGHSVRTLEDCRREAAADITVATNLIESRLLSGSNEMFFRMREVTSPANIWPSREFFPAKLTEQATRHRKFGDTAYKLEPNVKEGPGGLRDIQMIGWVTKRHLGATSLHELVEHEFLTEMEYNTLIAGQTFLWSVRFALHTLTGRAEDRLLFDYQRSIAGMHGYEDKNHNLAVEQFMQRYYRTITELARLNEMLLQHYREVILLNNIKADPQPINKRFQSRMGYLETTHPKVFRERPRALLELFIIMQQHPELKGVRASTIRRVRECRHLINKDFRNEFINRSMFMEILRQPANVTRELRRMNRYGVLAAYWPSFGKIVGRMQYDLFHAYTVDEHTLRVLHNVRKLINSEHSDEPELCYAIFKQIPKPELLYLAALFHDIAKGRGGNHSELGAVEAKTFCLNHGLSPYDAGIVSWLVSDHLVMSVTAQRKDICDPQVIVEFARKVGNLTRLNYLYLLTVADIRGTNPSLWNAWKDSLLRDLYNYTKRMMRRGLDNPLDRKELAIEIRHSALELLIQQNVPKANCLELWEDFDDQYFLRHSDDEVAWHTRSILESDPEMRPLVLIRDVTARGSTEITIYSKDRYHLFAHITAAIAQLGLNIVDARIITTRSDDALDTFLVLDDTGKAIEEAYHLKELKVKLYQLLQNPDLPPVEVVRPLPRKLRHFQVPTEIHFENEPGCEYTTLELITTDHPGLLSKIGKAFMETDVFLQDARITTIGERVEDIFFISDMHHQPVSDLVMREKIRLCLLRQLDMLAPMDHAM